MQQVNIQHSKMQRTTIKTLMTIGTMATLLSTGCVWKPDLAPTELKKWELPNSQYVSVDDLKVHVVQSPSCQSNDTIQSSTIVGTPLIKAATDKASSNSTIDNSSTSDKDSRSKETIVLLHGTSASLHTWNGWSDILQQQYCVVRMDLPAFGLTGPYANPNKRYTIDNYVDTVIGVMGRIKTNDATIAGNSLGGGIAWLTTLRHPDRINRLILVDASGFPFTPKHVPMVFKLAQYPILDPLVEKVLPKSVVRKSIESVYADDAKVSDELVNRYYELTRREGNRKALTQRMRESFAENEVAQIGNIKQPTLILWGAKDDLIPLENAYKFKKAIPNSQLVVFDNLGHVPQEEDPEATAAAVMQFLQQSK